MDVRVLKNTWFSNTNIYFNVSLRSTHFSTGAPQAPPKIAYAAKKARPVKAGSHNLYNCLN